MLAAVDHDRVAGRGRIDGVLQSREVGGHVVHVGAERDRRKERGSNDRAQELARELARKTNAWHGSDSGRELWWRASPKCAVCPARILRAERIPFDSHTRPA
ncbi:MAG: hypothetical protein DHS20C15_07290 [Planctomycetota bacterium]|nr:MAG: hypothetical protein DHS20C15_07290 [Planctomycetota bacterium]